MHELSLACALIEKIESLKQEHHFKTVKKIIVEIGTFSNVVPELFKDAFECAKIGSCAQSATLTIEDKRGRFICKSCGKTYTPEIPIAICPYCGKPSGMIEQGREIILKTLEVDDED